MFNWPHWLYGCWMSHSALCVLTAHSLSAIYPKISGKCTSVTQVYSACFPVDTTTLVTLRNVDQSVQSYFKQESRKQEMAFKGYHLNSAASLLSLLGWEVIQGHLADLLNHPSWTEHHSLPSASVSNSQSQSLCRSTLVLNISSVTPLFFPFTPSNSSILSHRGLVCVQ